MRHSRWKTLAALTVLGGLLAGCCVAPVGPAHPRYGGRVMMREPAPVVVVPAPPPRWGWRR